jgi:hypothetical protein
MQAYTHSPLRPGALPLPYALSNSLYITHQSWLSLDHSRKHPLGP